MGRTSPRQALAVLATAQPGKLLGAVADRLPAEVAADLLRCRLLDTLANLVRVDGATIAVVVPDADASREVAPGLPAGVDVMVLDGPTTDAARTAQTVRRHLALAFERVVVVGSGALPVPSRTASTGLSVLAGADLVVGPTPSGRTYLIGACDERGAAVLEAADEGSVEAIERRARDEGLVVRRLERRRVLSEHHSVADLFEAIAPLADIGPCLVGWLERHRGRLVPPS